MHFSLPVMYLTRIIFLTNQEIDNLCCNFSVKFCLSKSMSNIAAKETREINATGMISYLLICQLFKKFLVYFSVEFVFSKLEQFHNFVMEEERLCMQ